MRSDLGPAGVVLPEAPARHGWRWGLIVPWAVVVVLVGGVAAVGIVQTRTASDLADVRAELAGTQGRLASTSEQLDDVEFKLGQSEREVDGLQGMVAEEHGKFMQARSCILRLSHAFKGSVLTASYRMLPVINSPDCQSVLSGKWHIS